MNALSTLTRPLPPPYSENYVSAYNASARGEGTETTPLSRWMLGEAQPPASRAHPENRASVSEPRAGVRVGSVYA